jgi:hypothetical protein
MERYGLGSGDLPLITQRETDLFMASEQAKQNKGAFFSVGGYHIAQDLVPNLSHSPLSNVVALERTLISWEDRMRKELEGQGTGRVQMKPVQEAMAQIDQARQFLHQWEAYTTPDNKTVVTYKGNQLDPSNFKKVVKADGLYRWGGEWAQGNYVVEKAKAAGISPQEYARRQNPPINLYEEYRGK